MNEGRSFVKESANNLISLTLVQIISFIVGIISRAIFINKLGNAYLGISGLYSSILMILSLSELGMGEAFTYTYILAFAEKNESKVGIIFRCSKKLFSKVALLVSMLGIAFIPLLNLITNESSDFKEFYVYYLIFVANNALSYLSGPYAATYQADQRIRVTSTITLFSSLITTFLQMISLLFFANYLVYLVLMIVGNIVTYMILRLKFQRDYQWVLNIEYDLSEEYNFRKQLYGRMKDTFVMKVSGTIMESIDNICISKFIGLETVGKYNNYSTVTNTLRTAAKNVYSSVFSSIGIMNARQNADQRIEYFHHILFLFHVIATIVVVGVFTLISDFIPLWIGNESVLPMPVVLVICLDLYINILIYAPSNYVQTTKVLHDAKKGFVLTAMCNLSLSVVFGKIYGLFGILLATPIARIMFSYPIVIREIYRTIFCRSSKNGIILSALYFVQMIMIAGITALFVGFMETNSVNAFLLKSLVTVTIIALALFISNLWNKSEIFFIHYLYMKFKYKRRNG